MSLREEIARLRFRRAIKSIGEPLGCWEEEREAYLKDADEDLTLFRQKVEGIENPYPETRGHFMQRDMFESCRQAVLELLKEEK